MLLSLGFVSGSSPTVATLRRRRNGHIDDDQDTFNAFRHRRPLPNYVTAHSMTVKTLLLDEGVLNGASLCEFGTFEAKPDLCLSPWRADALRAKRLGVQLLSDPAQMVGQRFGQCVVHLEKSKAASLQWVALAWQHLEQDGQLLVYGYNELGIASFVKRIQKQLVQRGRVLTNRARGRIVAFDKSPGIQWQAEEIFRMAIETPRKMTLEQGPGVFGAQGLDTGTRLLLSGLEQWAASTPERILDMGCGAGALAFSAKSLWPRAEVWGADHDQRAINALRQNATRLGLEAKTLWWHAAMDPGDMLPAVDLVLMNPPFHQGKDVDFDVPRAMFGHLPKVLAGGGRALIVANRKLPYEADLRALPGVKAVAQLAQEQGFKVLAVDF